MAENTLFSFIIMLIVHSRFDSSAKDQARVPKTDPSSIMTLHVSKHLWSFLFFSIHWANPKVLVLLPQKHSTTKFLLNYNTHSKVTLFYSSK